MWPLLALLGLGGGIAFSKYHKAGGVKGIGKAAGIEAAKALGEGIKDQAKSIANDIKVEAVKVYHVAIESGKHPEVALNAAKDAINKLVGRKIF